MPCTTGASPTRSIDAHARIERGHRVLEDHLQLELGVAPGLAVELVERRAAESHAAVARGIDAGGDAAERRLAAAGLADQPDHLAFADRQMHVVDRMHHRLVQAGAEQVGGARREIERLDEALAHAFERDDRLASCGRLAFGMRVPAAGGAVRRMARPWPAPFRRPRRRARSAARRRSPAAAGRARAARRGSGRKRRAALLPRPGAEPISPRV